MLDASSLTCVSAAGRKTKHRQSSKSGTGITGVRDEVELDAYQDGAQNLR